MKDKKIIKAMTGAESAAHIAYKYSEFSAIFPISPSSVIAEEVEARSSVGEKNLLGRPVMVEQMQSEAGAAGCLHGAVQNGLLSTTFTASQGLLLMIPSLYKLKGQLLPSVFYVAARSLASRSLSIFCDHQDVYATRSTGTVIMSCHSTQQIMDLSPVAHAVALEGSTPVINFFDGHRTSAEVQKTTIHSDEELKKFISQEHLEKFRNRALTPYSPVTRGGSEDESTYFQSLEAQNQHNNNIINVAKKYYKIASKISGKEYAPFVYFGAKDATKVIVAMGSVTEALEEVVETLNHQGEKVGLLKVYLYRPFSIEDCYKSLPKTIEKIAVLDRTKEIGSAGEPLFLDIEAAISLNKSYFNVDPEVVGGRYGLSSKDVPPSHLKSVFDFLDSKNMHHNFTIGIIDDVTHLSIPLDESFKVKSKSQSIKFWGLAGDGSVSASKSIAKIIGDYGNLYTQGYNGYDSRKAGGATWSFITYDKEPIRSTYYPVDSKYIICAEQSFLFSIHKLIDTLQVGGVFLLNTTFNKDDLIKVLPARLKKQLAEKKANLYIVDAIKLGKEVGMNRFNTILQSAFFSLNEDIMSFESARNAMKDLAKKAYGKKGNEIVELNYKAIDHVTKNKLTKIEIDPEWANINVKESFKIPKTNDEFVNIVNRMDGDKLPTSFFNNPLEGQSILDGTMINNVTFNQKRQLAKMVPKWIKENCIQCAQCSFYCPHATIRAFQLSDEDIKNAPSEVESLEQIMPQNKKYRFKIHVDAENCVGCGLCATVCPGKGPNKKALVMTPSNELAFKNVALTEYLYKKIEYKTEGYDVNTMKGAALLYPYFEGSGACPGCGEAPYYKLLTQLFGKEMIIANATGCTSIYCGTYPYTPFATDSDGQGPAWANSLFEDNAEFGFGMVMSSKFKRAKLAEILESHMDKAEPDLKKLIKTWFSTKTRYDHRRIRKEMISLLKSSKSPDLKKALEYKDYIVKPSHWIIGGDGWSYDIGYGGLDHVLASGEDVNVMILDTEIYSNTGGQKSKSTNLGAIAKFANKGKKVGKKNICRIFMTYENIYVARVSLGMNQMQVIKSFNEAESYEGPSIVLCYAPCIDHGIKGGMSQHRNHAMNAVMCGYWNIYRYDPRLIEKGENPLQLDYKTPNFDNLIPFLRNENRFDRLFREDEKSANEFAKQLKAKLKNNFEFLLRESKK